MTEKTGTTIKADCNSCGRFRNHLVLKGVRRSYSQEDDGFDGGEEFLLLKCAGCENISLRHDSWNYYDVDPETGPEITSVYYPPAIARKEPEWLTGFNSPFFFEQTSTIVRLLKEIYSALHNDSLALTAMGVRALIEHIMIDRVGDHGTIGNNVKRFIADGYIAPKSERLFTEQLLEYGHAAMHRGHFPKASDLSALLDITESLIETIYVHPHRAKGMSSPPPRKLKNDKSSS